MITDNFTIREVAHRPLPSRLISVGFAATQHMQNVRDAACKHFGKDVPHVITSGYRNLDFNRNIKSSDRSYHIWRIGGTQAHAKDSTREQGRALFAIDFEPVGVDLVRYYEWYTGWIGGETYLHLPKRFIHTAPNADNKKPWIRR